MQAQSVTPLEKSDGQTRRALKRAARALFAAHGIGQVSVREIARAASHRNMGAIAYHFGSKEALVVELLTDGAERIEQRRWELIRKLDARGSPATMTEIVSAIVEPSAQFAEEDEEYGSHFNRFLLQLESYDPRFVDRHLAGRWKEGYQWCLGHLRQRMPRHTQAEQNRRLVFFGTYVAALLARREEMLADPSQDHPTWRSPDTLADIVRTAAALLEAPAAG